MERHNTAKKRKMHNKRNEEGSEDTKRSLEAQGNTLADTVTHIHFGLIGAKLGKPVKQKPDNTKYIAEKLLIT